MEGARRHGVLPLLFLTLLATPPPALGQGEAFTGVTLFQEGTRIELTQIHDDRRVRTDATILNLTYGVTTDFTAGLTVPVLWKRETFDAPGGGRESRGDRGLGDISLSGKYRLLRSHRVQRSTQIALVGGLKLPTGSPLARATAGRGSRSTRRSSGRPGKTAWPARRSCGAWRDSERTAASTRRRSCAYPRTFRSSSRSWTSPTASRGSCPPWTGMIREGLITLEKVQIIAYRHGEKREV